MPSPACQAFPPHAPPPSLPLVDAIDSVDNRGGAWGGHTTSKAVKPPTFPLPFVWRLQTSPLGGVETRTLTDAHGLSRTGTDTPPGTGGASAGAAAFRLCLSKTPQTCSKKQTRPQCRRTSATSAPTGFNSLPDWNKGELRHSWVIATAEGGITGWTGPGQFSILTTNVRIWSCHRPGVAYISSKTIICRVAGESGDKG